MKIKLEKHENKITGQSWYSVFTDNPDLHGIIPKHFDTLEDAEARFNEAVKFKGVEVDSTLIKEVTI